MKTIETGCFGIKVTLTENGGGSIVSDLRELPDSDSPDEKKANIVYNTMIDVLESIILAHACAGIDITAPAYMQGIEVSYEKCLNFFT